MLSEDTADGWLKAIDNTDGGTIETPEPSAWVNPPDPSIITEPPENFPAVMFPSDPPPDAGGGSIDTGSLMPVAIIPTGMNEPPFEWHPSVPSVKRIQSFIDELGPTDVGGTSPYMSPRIVTDSSSPSVSPLVLALLVVAAVVLLG